jgi:small subunit ribosomal protein S6
MSKVICDYELYLIFSIKISEKDAEEIIKKNSELIEKSGEVKSIDRWGSRKFAYPIKKEDEGVYTIIKFRCAPGVPGEITRIMNITEGVLRFMIIKSES